MEVYKIVDGFTSDCCPITEVEALSEENQVKIPHAVFLNYNCHGYG